MWRTRAATAACAVAIAIVLVCDVSAAVILSHRDRISTPAALKGVLPGLRAFVEKTRGLQFRHGVDISLLDDADFDALFTGGNDTVDPITEYQQSKFLQGFLRAFGLVPDDFSLSSLASDGVSNVLGLYRSQKRTVYLRSSLPGPRLRRVLVHELTHALDDQYFHLDNIKVDIRTEQGRALQALVEGDAVYVDTQYRASLSPGDQTVADGPVEGLDPTEEQAALFLALLSFPYAVGPQFVAALRERDGAAGVDAAFRQPPQTSEAILHPDRYPETPPATAVVRPVADGPVLGLGVLGEVGLTLLLRENLDRPAAIAAADGWGSDRYIAWTDNERVCVRDNLSMDTPKDTAEVRDALRKWATGHSGAKVTANGDTTTITRCA